ncbi:T9SS type A sorting domain-containing protein [Winogradskyella sp. PE311]|uniref:T9SS type A sorting domain-containing protein n=1 Tax=Winogradskyella sp. PE311 TaxID=3366943 RepID=UPI00397FFA09
MNFLKLPKSLSLLFVLLISINFSFSQTDDCGFEYTQAEQDYFNSVKDQVKKLEEQFLQERLNSRAPSITTAVPVKAHIIRQTDGTGGLTPLELEDAMSIMNGVYFNAGLEFFLCEGINYIDDDTYYNYDTSEESAMTAANGVNGVINIYFTNAVFSGSNALCGYAYFPGGPETILMANNCTTNGSTLSHEMGHFFALPHTHGNSNVPGSTEELVNGTNCETTGDFICDTPADPQLGGSNVDFLCQYTGNAIDANNEQYTPDPDNFMSYSLKQCRSVFSPQQLARINAIYQISRNNLGCPSFNTDFTADETNSCLNNLTVNFTDNSVGATSWSWDIDANGIEDYSTQNITHTYDAAGDYDVVLTISNGSEEISKVKTEYISVGGIETITTTITMNLTLDDWPAETSWQFLDENDALLYSGGPYTEGVDDFTTKTAVFDIANPDSCYKFILSDSYGDGICCASGIGNYELRADDNSLLASGGAIGSGVINNFFSGTLSVNSFKNEIISLFPNPSNNLVTIKSPSLPDTYTIYNTLGQVIKQSIIKSDSDLVINVENFDNGMYFIKLTKASSSQVISFVKN